MATSERKSEDVGVGDTKKFPAEDLERLYRSDRLSNEPRIRGDVLNRLRGVTCYSPRAWYTVTNDEVKKI